MLARKPSRSAGRYCIRLSRVFTSAVCWARLRLARLASERLRCDQTSSTGLSSCAYGGSWQTADGQPVPGPEQFGHRGADVRIQVIPDEHERAGELLVRGVQEPGVISVGEALAVVLAVAAAALVHAVDQPGPAPGLDGNQRGERDALVAAAGHRHHRGSAAPAPGASLRRP